MAAHKPRVGITIGNAAGIGPEVVLRAMADLAEDESFFPVLIGDAKFLEDLGKKLGIEIELVPYGSNVEHRSGTVSIVDLRNLPDDLELGVESEAAGRASGEYIEKAVAMWREGSLEAIATAPISKRSLALGGYDFPGHTEFLAYLTATERFAMSFFADELRVVLLSTHLPIVEAIRSITVEKVVSLIEFADRTLSHMLGRRVNIAVAGVNPHASENGMFGTEEAEIISPAIDHCRDKLGIDVSGPYSPDTIFLRGYQGEFDVVIAGYHDQATIPVKALSFGSAVNVTLGLPLIRTSVDHGTAFDIVGKRAADHSSMKAAIKLAAELAAGTAANSSDAETRDRAAAADQDS
jgi:4-hydroxythreonine-4-phosphate dehydrogenase